LEDINAVKPIKPVYGLKRRGREDSARLQVERRSIRAAHQRPGPSWPRRVPKSVQAASISRALCADDALSQAVGDDRCTKLTLTMSEKLLLRSKRIPIPDGQSRLTRRTRPTRAIRGRETRLRLQQTRLRLQQTRQRVRPQTPRTGPSRQIASSASVICAETPLGTASCLRPCSADARCGKILVEHVCRVKPSECTDQQQGHHCHSRGEHAPPRCWTWRRCGSYTWAPSRRDISTLICRFSDEAKPAQNRNDT
jgi:hypothetical protein